MVIVAKLKDSNKTLATVIIVILINVYISTLVVMIDQGRQYRHSLFKAIFGPLANNWGKRLTLFVTVLFIREEWLILHTLLKTDLSRQFCSGKLLQIGKNTLQGLGFVGESGKKLEKYSRFIYWIIYLLTSFYGNLSFEFLALCFFCQTLLFHEFTVKFWNSKRYWIKTKFDQPSSLGIWITVFSHFPNYYTY